MKILEKGYSKQIEEESIEKNKAKITKIFFNVQNEKSTFT